MAEGYSERCMFNSEPGKGESVSVTLDRTKPRVGKNVLQWIACKCGCKRIEPKFAQAPVLKR